MAKLTKVQGKRFQMPFWSYSKWSWYWLKASTSGRVGSSYAKFLPRDTEWEGSFEVQLIQLTWKTVRQTSDEKTIGQVRKKTLLNKEDIPCSEVTPLREKQLAAGVQEPGYSFQSCVLTWVTKEAGCHLDWFRWMYSVKWTLAYLFSVADNFEVLLLATRPSMGLVPVHELRK